MVKPAASPIEERTTAVIQPLWGKWSAKTERTLKQERDGYTLHMEEEPFLVLNQKAESVGVRFFVRLFDPNGKEVNIDHDRQILNPPTQIVVSRAVYETNEKGEAVPDKDGEPVLISPRVLRYDPEAAIWEVLWQSVLTVPGVV